MIRSVQLICAECGESFVPQDGVLYYKDNYINNTVKEAKFICPACIKNGTINGRLKMPSSARLIM